MVYLYCSPGWMVTQNDYTITKNTAIGNRVIGVQTCRESHDKYYNNNCYNICHATLCTYEVSEFQRRIV